MGRACAIVVVAVAAVVGACAKKKRRPAAKPGGTATAKPEPGRLRPAPSPRDILRRALRAHGGVALLREKLARHTRMVSAEQFRRQMNVIYYWRAPEHLAVGDRDQAVIHRGGKCFEKYRAITRECRPAVAQVGEQMIWVTRWLTLYPLAEPGVRLAPAVERQIGGKRALGIRATTADGRRTMTLHFFAADGLLAEVRYAGTWTYFRGELVTTIEGYHVAGKLVVPDRFATRLGDKVVLREHVVRWRFGQADMSAFQEPARTPVGISRVQLDVAFVVAYARSGPSAAARAAAEAKLRAFVEKRGLRVRGPVTHLLADAGRKPATHAEVRLPVVDPGQSARRGGALGIKQVFYPALITMFVRGTWKAMLPRFAELAAWAKRNQMRVVGRRAVGVWRKPATPGGEGMWEIAYELGGCGLVGRVKSHPSLTPVPVEFVNRRRGTVTVRWLKLDGGGKVFATVAPGKSTKINSYHGHLWEIRDSGGGCIDIYKVPPQPARFTIR